MTNMTITLRIEAEIPGTGLMVVAEEKVAARKVMDEPTDIISLILCTLMLELNHRVEEETAKLAHASLN